MNKAKMGKTKRRGWGYQSVLSAGEEWGTGGAGGRIKELGTELQGIWEGQGLEWTWLGLEAEWRGFWVVREKRGDQGGINQDS